ncbi:hypothetical protein [Deferrisoma sp.]
MDRERWVLVGLAALFAAWAALELPGLGRDARARPDPCAARVEPAAVEASYRDTVARLEAGDDAAAVLELRRRAEAGPHPAWAWFWLGEAAYRRGAWAEAVARYARAVDENPAAADRTGPFRSGAVMAERLQAIRSGPWAQDPPPEVRKLYALQRRLAGGCE